MYNDENNQYNPRPRFDPKTGERIHYDDENTTETTQAESSEYRYSAGNIPFEQENNNTSYYQQSSTFQQDASYQQAGAGQGSMNQQNGRQKKKKDRNKDGFGERLAKLAGSAAVFGVIAGAVMYGVYYTGSTILPVKSSSDYNNRDFQCNRNNGTEYFISFNGYGCTVRCKCSPSGNGGIKRYDNRVFRKFFIFLWTVRQPVL